jgi:hypothetical protein
VAVPQGRRRRLLFDLSSSSRHPVTSRNAGNGASRSIEVQLALNGKILSGPQRYFCPTSVISGGGALNIPFTSSVAFPLGKSNWDIAFSAQKPRYSRYCDKGVKLDS